MIVAYPCTPAVPPPRGDGPRVRRAFAVLRQVPPPTRGWPRRALPPGASFTGSPAHAGMATPLTPAERARRWFPRPENCRPLQYMQG